MIILGVICLGFWSLGAWFRKIANQSADFCERVVEAQFAAHTKNLKSRRRDQDAQFLAERVIDPELLLRSSDDRDADRRAGAGQRRRTSADGPVLFENRELAFLRNVRLLYQDYLDGSPLHRSDTKASVQLLGNLALANLRRSHLRHLLRESRTIDRLDLSRAGGLFGGPYLWFNYITRLLVQETALLILDYNRHAIPLDRLACSPEPIRAALPRLAGRPAQGRPGGGLAARSRRRPMRTMRTSPIGRVNPTDPGPRRIAGCAHRCRLARREAGAFLETVEFTAVDFLADDPERDAEIHARFGPQVAELVRRDRQQNVRRAFRSFPLHELPRRPARSTRSPSTRPISPAAGSSCCRSTCWRAIGPGAWCLAVRSVYRVVREILHPQVDRTSDRSVRHLLGRPAQDPPHAQACVHGIALAAGAVRRGVPGAAAAHGPVGASPPSR